MDARGLWLRGLTLAMSGNCRRAKRAGSCPLDQLVRAHCLQGGDRANAHEAMSATQRNAGYHGTHAQPSPDLAAQHFALALTRGDRAR
jgi:hypothetical protein